MTSARITAIVTILLWAATAGAQPTLLTDDLEWGDTGEWTTTHPSRCDDLPAFDRGIGPARILHVDDSGNDTTGDGSAGNPFASIGRAAQNATPGTAIRVHAGTYPGGTFLYDLRGTPSAPIWIGGAPGEPRPVIDGGGEGLHLVRPAWVVVHDLEVRNASSNGINCDDGGDVADPLAAHHVVFRRLDIHDIGGTGNQDCLKLSGLNDFQVMLSTFARCGGGLSGSGVDHVGCHRGLLARNTFAQMSGNAIQAKGGSSDLEIRWNRFTDSGQRTLNLGGSTGYAYFRPPLSTTEPNAEARNLKAISNLFEGSWSPIAYVGCVGCVVAHNTIVDPDNWIIRILQETVSDGTYTFEACRDGVFTNNLVSFSRSGISTYVNIGPNTASDTFTFTTNLWHAWDNPPLSQPTLPAAETGGIYGLDPLLDADHRISPSSPAAGAGTPTPWTSGDLDGLCYGAPPSVGAFEAR